MANARIHNLQKNPRVELNYTIDKFLDGRITIKQPVEGFRAGCDSIFLAASIQPKADDRVLDLGAGVGVVSLALAARCANIKIVALENEPNLVSLALSNIQDNQMSAQVEVHSRSLHLLTPKLTSGLFDYVITNPPYHQSCNSVSSNHLKSSSKTEDISLEEWIACCYRMLKPNGLLSMIHRPARLQQILHSFINKFGDLTIFPLWGMNNETTTRCIIQAKKDGKGRTELCYGMHTNDTEGKLTEKANDILRNCKRLKI